MVPHITRGGHLKPTGRTTGHALTCLGDSKIPIASLPILSEVAP